MLVAWFLGLTYIAIIWANASALPLVFHAVFGDVLHFGFHYTIAGYEIYFGEALAAVLALCAAALLCLRRELAMKTQIVMVLALCAGVLVCFIGALARGSAPQPFRPAFSPDYSPIRGSAIIFALAPWAYVGFESICHSTEEARFPLKKSFAIMVAALAAGGAVYVLLSLLAVTSLPEGCSSWVDYLAKLGSFEGAASQPTFFAAQRAMGGAGSAILGVAALCAIFTGLIGNFIALSRLLRALADDGLLPARLGKVDKNHVPRTAILLILALSVIFPFLGRTAISWIVDVTTVGATISYAVVSASAWKMAQEEKNGRHIAAGVLGLVISVLFALEFLIPNITAVKTLSTESYLILALWCLLGFALLRLLIVKDRDKRLGRSVFALVVLLSIIIFTSSVWMLQSANHAVAETIEPVEDYVLQKMADIGDGEGALAASNVYDSLRESETSIDRTLTRNSFLQVGMIVIALAIMMDIIAITQDRVRRTEIEKAVAEDASRAKTSFLSNMSHEIRTPMNAIIGLDNIALQNPDLQPQTRDQLEKIGASARHLLGLINDILDMSRIESGRMTLNEQEFSMQDFLKQVNIIVNGQCADKGLNYKCNFASPLRDYYIGDDMKLKQVLINILGNAVKFTDAPGDVTLTVEQVEENGENATLRFTMRDTGIGMDADYIPKIFEAFSQEDVSYTSRYGGSGLGMAITKSFVELMHGTIEVQSKKGVGSTFTVTVPLKRSEQSFEADETIAVRHMRAAVVDDDPTSCEHAQIVLRSIGIESDAFLDPWEALARIREAQQMGKPYRVVITDFKMPTMNGLELTRQIREFDDYQTAIIMLTGYNWDIIEEEATGGGVDSIGAKPLFADSLVRELQTILARKEGREMPAAGATACKCELAGRRILMAEDIEQNAEILHDLLELEDMESEHAVNGKLAAEMFAASEPGYYDAILMDVRMPVMDGLEATKVIRAMARPDAKSIPIIAMTANAFDEDVKRSLEAGMNAHLSKPVEMELLYTTLTKYICARG